MDAAALAGLCLLLAHGAAPRALPEGVICPAPAAAPAGVMAAGPTGLQQAALARAIASADARDGIARVAWAEAANQGDSGLAGVVYTILNRLADGRWGVTVDAVLDAPHQFEPVLRAGGSWRNLRPVSEAQRARIDTILNLALDGRLPDPTNGARYFQNPRTVASRAASGQVAPSLVNFGGAAPTAVIGAHSFYAEAGGGGDRRRSTSQPAVGGRPRSDVILSAAGGAIFVGENRASMAPVLPVAQVDDGAGSIDPARAIFVRPDGRASADRR